VPYPDRRSPKLAAFVALAGPPDLLTRDAGRSSPINRGLPAARSSSRRSSRNGPSPAAASCETISFA